MDFHLAQLNIGRIVAPLDSPVMADFTNNLISINTLADTSPGFVWRMKDEADNATSIRMYDDHRIIVNMSVWETPEHLYQYVYRSLHTDFLKRRREWFDKMSEMFYALWYIPAGHLPDIEEARERLEYLREHGETPYAFSFRQQFEPPIVEPQRMEPPAV
jgi:hypothetical protein